MRGFTVPLYTVCVSLNVTSEREKFGNLKLLVEL